MAVLLVVTSCTTHYAVSSVERTRLLIDKKYDRPMSEEVSTFMRPYKAKVDSLMSPVLGRAAKPLQAYRPESPLSNLLPDVLVWAGKLYHEKPDFAVYNYGGIRAALPAGDVTRGDVLDVAPFENKICFGTLRGADVLELFQQFMVRGPHGVSHGVELVFDKDLKLRSAKINGKPVDPEASYRFTTIDYVAHGNDGMTAFSKKFDFVEHKKAEDNSRDLIIEYFRDKLSRGETIDPKLEGRIQIEN